VANSQNINMQLRGNPRVESLGKFVLRFLAFTVAMISPHCDGRLLV